jgi:hypothetical protein
MSFSNTRLVFLSRIVALGAIVLVSGCAANNSEQPFPTELLVQSGERSPVELQALQTREFEGSKAEAVSAILAVFQDEGFRVDKAELDVGLLTATMPEKRRWVQIELPAFGDFNQWKFRYVEEKPNPSLSKAGVTSVSVRTVNVLVSEASPGRSKVRLTIILDTKLLWQLTGPYKGIDMDPEQYQRMFSKIQQALFLKKNID